MIGSRPLTDEEVALVLSHLDSVRDRALFITGLRTGFRISELLSLTVSSVSEYGHISDTITVNRKSMKGKHSSRSVPLHPGAKVALQAYLDTLPYKHDSMKLFPFTRQHAHRLLKRATRAAKLTGKVSTHSMRKTFADRVHILLDENIFKTQQALGHKSVGSTASYLSFKQEEIVTAILSTK